MPALPPTPTWAKSLAVGDRFFAKQGARIYVDKRMDRPAIGAHRETMSVPVGWGFNLMALPGEDGWLKISEQFQAGFYLWVRGEDCVPSLVEPPTPE